MVGGELPPEENVGKVPHQLCHTFQTSILPVHVIWSRTGQQLLII